MVRSINYTAITMLIYEANSLKKGQCASLSSGLENGYMKHLAINKLTVGHADLIQRAFSYLLFGGFAVIVNLLVFSLVYYQIHWPADQQWHYVLAFALASEISILANFFPNDAITFRRLPGHRRPWPVRCLRFHATYIAGTLLQLGLSFSLHLLGIPAVLAQAMALALATAFNFAFHHIFTYRSIAQSKNN